MAHIFIGTSGWYYRHWAGIFYPERLKPSEWLSYYSRYFPTVEINATFYREPKASMIEGWINKTPENFHFSVKMHRSITHYQRLENVEESLDRFNTIIKTLGRKADIILIQLPPSLSFDVKRCETFFKVLRLKSPGQRYALEARHTSWISESSYDLLETYHIAWCIADSGGRYPTVDQLTANYTYLRFHGPASLYASTYNQQSLEIWAEKIRSWKSEKKDVYAYFNNDFMGYALENAHQLIELLT